MEYYEFIESGFMPLDVLKTVTEGVVKIEAVVLDGETNYEVADEDFDGDTGVLFENEYNELQFISHGEVEGLAHGGF